VEAARLKAILESLLLAAGEPVTASKLASACEDESLEAVKCALDELAKEYADGRRGLTIEQVAGGYQLRTSLENAPYVRRLLATRQARLSRPLLEALAIIAYRQPITRAEIEQIRGVDCGGVLETLLARRLVRIAGRKAVPGRPILYATTAEFLSTFGLKSLKALPQIEGIDTLAGQTPPEMVHEATTDVDASAQEFEGEQPGDQPPGAKRTGAEQVATADPNKDEAPGATSQAFSASHRAANEARAPEHRSWENPTRPRSAELTPGERSARTESNEGETPAQASESSTAAAAGSGADGAGNERS
jgi:segregation and condensation protein B